jgi:hypothetical protein
MMQRVLLLASLLAALWSAGASAAETSCRVLGTTTFEVGKSVCMLSIRDNWLVCTGDTSPTGGGSWKDSGVPCKEQPPKSPADYRPIPPSPHPSSPPAEVKRVIDMFRGIVFRCQPSVNLSWSTDACDKITAEFTSEAKTAGIVIVVLDPADDDDAAAKKTEAAGFKPDDAVDWTVMLHATTTGGAVLSQEINGVMEVVPGIYNRRSLLLVSDAYLHPETAVQALAEVKADFGGQIQYFISEVK